MFRGVRVVSGFDFIFVYDCGQVGGHSFSTRTRVAITSAETPTFGAMRVAMQSSVLISVQFPSVTAMTAQQLEPATRRIRFLRLAWTYACVSSIPSLIPS